MVGKDKGEYLKKLSTNDRLDFEIDEVTDIINLLTKRKNALVTKRTKS